MARKIRSKQLVTDTDFYNQIEQLLIDSSVNTPVWDKIANVIKQVVPCDRMVIASTDVPRGLFSPIQISGLSIPDWDSSPVHRLGESLIGQAVSVNSPITSSTIPSMYTKHDGDDINSIVPSANWASGLGMRIVNGGEVVGAIVFLSHVPNAFDSDDFLVVEKVSRVLGPYLSQQTLQKEILRATEHQTKLEHLLLHLNDSQDPATFFNMFYSTFAARASLVYGALFAYDRYSDKYVPIAHVDGIGGATDSILQDSTRLLNENRLSASSVHLACEHKSVPASNIGTALMNMIRSSPDFKELCVIPLTAGSNRVGAIVFAISDCNPSMLERVEDIESAGPMASAFLQLHQTSRQWDRKQHIATVLQYAVDGLCEAPSSRQKHEFFKETMIRSIGASAYSFEITHRVTGVSFFSYAYPEDFNADSGSMVSGTEQLRVNSRLGSTHIVDVVASFDSGANLISALHELRAVVRVCASILGSSILSDPNSATTIQSQYSPNTQNHHWAEHTSNSFGLTPRESEILSYLSQGATNDEIAARCGITAGTVKNRLVSIYKKLGVRNRSEASIKTLNTGQLI
ncbi:MAG: hypothetical protein HOF01_08180 [Chloroflexi bacterium]|nr:hypothetical protein [Chloroflexota bacterium]